MTLFEVTQIERSRWQRRAAAELTAILDSHKDLPVIAWTVGPAGSALVGQINGLAPAAQVRDSFDAWREALDLTEHSQAPSGRTVYLRAGAYRRKVHIVVIATVFDDEDEAMVTSWS